MQRKLTFTGILIAFVFSAFSQDILTFKKHMPFEWVKNFNFYENGVFLTQGNSGLDYYSITDNLSIAHNYSINQASSKFIINDTLLYHALIDKVNVFHIGTHDYTKLTSPNIPTNNNINYNPITLHNNNLYFSTLLYQVDPNTLEVTPYVEYYRFNVEDPYDPIETGMTTTSSADLNYSLIANDSYIIGSRQLGTGSQDNLRLIDNTLPDTIKSLGTYGDTPSYTAEIKQHGDLILLAHLSGLKVYDISDINTVSLTYSYSANWGRCLELIDNYIVMGGNDGWHVFEILDNNTITHLQYIENDTRIWKLRYNEATNELWSSVHDGNLGGLVVFDVFNPLLPTINNQPENVNNLCIGKNSSYSVSGNNINKYQWQVNDGTGFADIINSGFYSNATTATLTISGVELFMNNYQYRCIVSNDGGNITSYPGVLNVIETDNVNPKTPSLSMLTNECSIISTPPTTTDNCAGIVTGTTTDPTEYTEQGTHTITWTFDDGNGNSIDVDQIVIIDDTIAPETPTLETLNNDCSVIATPPTTTDNCIGIVKGTTTDPTEYSEQGTRTITWTFDDGNGNSIDVDQIVVIDDVTVPETPILETLNDDCSVIATPPTTTDNCTGTITGTTTDPTEFTDQGTHTITWTFDDGNGNNIDVDQIVIIDDTTAPETPTLETLNDHCSVTATAPTTTDNCTGIVTGTTTDPIEYTEQGTYTITWTFDDDNGNSTSAEQTVIVEDVNNPVISCIENQEVHAETHFYIVQGKEFDPVEMFDNCEIASIENDFNNSSTLENEQLLEGITTIVWTITDINGNEITCNFNVTVNTITGIETLQQKGISIYPNPTKGIVNFDFAENNIQKMTISDKAGKQIFRKNNLEQNQIIDLLRYSDGIYVIRIHSGSEIFIAKILKE